MFRWSDRLSDLRKERGVSIKEVSDATGISVGALTGYENDERGSTGKPKVPNYLTIQKLAEYYTVPCSYLTGETDCKRVENVKIAKQLGLSEKAIEKLEAGLVVSEQTGLEWLNYSKIISLLLEDNAFCDMFFANLYHFLNKDSRESAFRAIKEQGILTKSTDGSLMFLIGIQQALSTLQRRIDKKAREQEETQQQKERIAELRQMAKAHPNIYSTPDKERGSSNAET